MRNVLPDDPLQSKLVFYLPSKHGYREISREDRARLVQATLNYLVTRFVGATELEGTGSWRNDKGAFVSERVTLCYSFLPENQPNHNAKIEINQLANALAVQFEQDSLSVEINGAMYFFSPTKTYRHNYQRLKDKMQPGEEWGFEKWLLIKLDEPPLRRT